MKYHKKQIFIGILCLTVALLSLSACSKVHQSSNESADSKQKKIEAALNLANNEEQEWTYSKKADAWTLSIVSAVAYPQLPDQQGVSVCVPGGYVTGIDKDKDGKTDITSQNYEKKVKGSLVIDYDATLTSTNGQIYKAATAPVILNTGAAGYSSQNNSLAPATYAADGYVNISCGNRGKQDTITTEDGETTYTGDAPTCLADQKAAARFIKYNILLGNLPGSVDYFVSTGGSGGGAHAAMFAATSNHSDYYAYQVEAGAVGVYAKKDGTYTTTVAINGTDYEISDGGWGSIAYSAITPLYEADMTLAFEYYMNTNYKYNTSFQKQLAEYLSEEYMEYINGQNLSVEEKSIGFDLNKDGDKKDTVKLTINYDLESHPDTNGYYGTYLDLYLEEFTENLQWYLDNLQYAEGWTWFDKNGNALSDDQVAAMSPAHKAEAFVAGRYTKSDSSKGKMTGAPGEGNMPKGQKPDKKIKQGQGPNKTPADSEGKEPAAGTPDGGTTQSADSKTDSNNYKTYNKMVEAYTTDIEDVYQGDKYGNNIVSLYNPLKYIGTEGTENPVWSKIVMGASEGDMSLFSSLNLQIAWLNAGVDAAIEWQWDGGHVPSEILGNSFSLYVDQMYGQYVDGAVSITKSEATAQNKNGDAEEMTGTDLSSWVDAKDTDSISFTLSHVLAYRTAGASKAVPGFDVIDYGQEDYLFGDQHSDARHWNKYLLNIFEKNANVLEPLFNSTK